VNIRGAVDRYDRETSEHIVAYLDILGIAQRMQQRPCLQIESLNKLHNLCRYIIELADEEKGIKKYASIKCRVFSDNIIIANELSYEREKRINDIENLLNCVSNFACSTVGDSVGWLLRGGITIGDFYINDTIVWGPALIRAYNLEHEMANYPRIIIDPPVLSEFNDRMSSEYISVDIDGSNYLNYMSIWHFSGACVKNAFEKIKAEARKPDGSYLDKTHQKLVWHMNYINGELDKKNERKDKKYRLNME
jgi:hypothetical protein